MYFILTFLCDYSFKAGIRNDNDDICILLTAFGVLRNIILQTVLLGNMGTSRYQCELKSIIIKRHRFRILKFSIIY